MMQQGKVSVIVTGGCGFIGAHVVQELVQQGYHAVVIDREKTALIDNELVDYYHFDMRQHELLQAVLCRYRPFAVIHLAALISVSESLCHPYAYYDNNVVGTLTLLKTMQELSIQRLIFSSSAAVYASGHTGIPLTEQMPCIPNSPYGWSKYMAEQIITDFARTHGMQAVMLRYFNAAGATPEKGLYERHVPETHLIPLVLKSLCSRQPVAIFGSDYPTKDGTCIRDYVHVRDIARAHMAALRYLFGGNFGNERPESAAIFNIAAQQGYSVRDVVEAASAVVKKSYTIAWRAARAGDVPILVADAQKAQRILGWRAQESSLETIIRDAWNAQRSIDSSACRAWCQHPVGDHESYIPHE